MGLAKDKKEKNCEGLALGGGSATPKNGLEGGWATPDFIYYIYIRNH